MNIARLFAVSIWVGAGLILGGAETEKMRMMAKGNFSGIQEPAQMVVTNATQWAEIWAKHSAQKRPAEPVPEIDFEKETVLFVALGQKRTGGYAVEIAEVKRMEGKVEVLVKTRKPKPGGFQLQALTAPFHAVAVPKISGAVKFNLQDAGG